MGEFIKRALTAAGKYTVWDFGFLKISILSVGILLGAYFAGFLLKYALYLWILFAVSFLWILYRTFAGRKN